MVYQDRALRTYSENGIRTAEDWQSLGRLVMAGTEPRARIAVAGKELFLYTRDQTERRPPSARHRAARVGGGTPGPRPSRVD